jgi:DNA polymerase III epsilon subunit-like protein
MKTFFFFDTETNGLPLNYRAPVEDLNNWPRVTQLAFIMYGQVDDKDPFILQEYAAYIKPEGWEVPKEKFFADQGITTEMLNEKGVPIIDALTEYCAGRAVSDYSIAHNISFDSKILRAEIMRLQSETSKIEFASKKICTMMESTQYCQLTTEKSNRFKWPTLQELHTKLFNEGFEDAHDALADIRATAKCFFELVKRGVIKL